MPVTLSEILKTLKKDFPAITFRRGDTFQWDPSSSSLFYNANDSQSLELLMHEVAHAQLAHQSFSTDMELIRMEREAWDYAVETFTERYAVPISIDTVEDSLDSYRNWLHKRSTCPSCDATGIQTDKRTYKCLACGSRWRVNEARSCQLRRYITKKAR